MNEKNGEDQSWRAKVSARAIAFASRTHMGFRQEMQSTLKLLPVDSAETRIQQLNVFVDALAGATTAIACEYAGSNLDVEEQFIKLIRAKFKMIRQAELMDNTGVQ